MSAKLLNVYVEEKRELEKQMGCMAGMFQMFDRRRLLTGRRLTGITHKKLSSSGRALARDSNQREECSPSSPQIVLEYNPGKSSNENRRASSETSRASFSSSPSFSSSLERSKSTKPRSSDVDTKSAHNDFRGIAKESINGEMRCLSVKTSIQQEVKKDNILKHRDSPRPVLPLDLNASMQVMRRLKEVPSNLCEVSRFSCDGREITQTKSAKVRELPRFSLDSKDSSLRSSKFDPKPKELDRSPNQRVPSVVAKLMGLEAMPSSAPLEPTGLAYINTKKGSDPFNGDSEKNHVLRTLRGSLEASDARIWKHSGPNSKQSESVYIQIERRLKELDFQESNKDLRALKHILDTMQAKGLIETKKGNDQQAEVISRKNLNINSANAQTPHITTPRAFESPIVIMKPAKSINRLDELEGLSGLRKLRTSAPTNRKQTKEQESLRYSSSEKRTEEMISPQKTRTPVMQRSPRPQQSVRERSASPVKTSSPRVQQRKVELEKKPRSPIRRQSSNRQPEEPISPSIKHKLKPNQAQKNSQRNKQRDEISHHTMVDADASDNCSMKGKQKSLRILHEEVSTAETAFVPPEQPSPISVLDASFYHDEELSPSPVKRISIALEDDEIQTSSENCRNPMSVFAASLSKSSLEMDSLKLVNIRNLVQKLRQLSSTGDTESQEPVLDYVFEILAASGLLPEDHSSETGYTKSNLTKSNTGKLHHMLMLDVVQEILVQKLELLSHCPQSDLFNRARKLGGQFFLRELCSEIKWLLAERSRGTGLNNEEEMCSKDLLPRSEGWEDFGVEASGVVLEIERVIFKDLVDEIISGEANSSLLGKSTRRRRQLFT